MKPTQAELREMALKHFPGVEVVFPEPLAVPRNYRELESQDLMTKMSMLQMGMSLKNTPASNPVFERHRKDLFSRILNSESPIAIVLDAVESVFFVHLRTRPQTGMHESYLVDLLPLDGSTAQETYIKVVLRFANYGFTEKVLKSRLKFFEYELADVFDPVAHVFKQRINQNLVILPYLSHHTGMALMRLLRSHLDNLGVDAMMCVLVSMKDQRAKTLMTALAQLTDEDGFEPCEEWLLEAGEAAVDFWAKHGKKLPDEEVGLFADFADVLEPLKGMKEKLMEAFDTSKDSHCWLGAKINMGAILSGKGQRRGQLVKDGQDDGIGMDYGLVIDDIIELFDARFHMGNDGGLAKQFGSIMDLMRDFRM